MTDLPRWHPPLIDCPPDPVRLSHREAQVLMGMCHGRTNAEIGRRLYITEDTVKTHARRLYRKLHARDRAHAVAIAHAIALVVAAAHHAETSPPQERAS